MGAGMSDKVLVHVSRIRIRWSDMDEFGHVNNAVFFTYLETARIEWLHEIGCAPNTQGEGPVLVNASCSFLKQLRYPGEVEVRTLIGEIGRSSFMSYGEIRRVDDPTVLIGEGGAKVVWIDFQRQKSQPLSDALRACIVRPTQAALAALGRAG